VNVAVSWGGTEEEYAALKVAVARNCACVWTDETRTVYCGACYMLENDQRALNGLVMCLRAAAALKEEEFSD